MQLRDSALIILHMTNVNKRKIQRNKEISYPFALFGSLLFKEYNY